ncbi:MAG: septal ring lytic transglycosylase RlpA family protein [Alphaproteobacteria bacterium]|nr:septal ring lytic transglycosylase RlpA family protein [Alphaproteobacteria bacterium]
MVKVLNKVLLASCIVLLGGCTDNGLLFRSFGTYETNKDTITYKIGEPYQIKDVWYTPKEDYSYSETGIAGWYQEENGELTANGEKYDDDIMSAMHKTLPLPSLVRVTNLENGNVAIVRVNERGPYVNNRLIDVSQKTAEALEFNMVGTTMVKIEVLADESRDLKREIFKENGLSIKDVQNEENVISGQVQIDTLSDPQKTLYQPDDENTILYADSNIPTISDDPDNVSGIVSITKPVSDITSEALIKTQNIASVKPVVISEQVQEAKLTPPTEEPKLITPISGHYIQAGAFSNAQNAEKLKQSLEEFGPVQLYETTVNDKTLLRVRMGPLETQENAQELLEKLKTAGYNQAKIIYEP